MQIKKIFLKVFTFFMSLAMVAGLFSVNTNAREEAETATDITDKVTIDDISSSNAEIKDSTNISDFTAALSYGSNVDYKIDLTVDKGTAFQSGDFIDIPFKADHGYLTENVGLEVLDSVDGSILGEATITKDNIHIKFTQKNSTKTAAKLTIATTLRGVASYTGNYPTQAEVDAAYADKPSGIDKVQILNKNANVHVKSQYWLQNTSKTYDSYPIPSEGQEGVFIQNNTRKDGVTAPSNTTTSWLISWNHLVYKYELKSPSTGETGKVDTYNPITATYFSDYDAVYGSYSATENNYVEDILPGDIYKNITFGNAGFYKVILNKDGEKPIVQEAFSNGKITGTNFKYENATLPFDQFFTKKDATAGQTYEQFKASLKPGEYGVYTSSNGDMHFVASLGKIGSKDPNSMYTWGDLCAKIGKDVVINKLFGVEEIAADGGTKRIPLSEEMIEKFYNKVKDLPISRLGISFTADLQKPVLRNGTKLTNTATVMDKSVTGTNTFIVGEISLLTYKDGLAILKTDEKSGQGIADAEFKLQEKDAAGAWVDTDATFVKDNVTIVGENAGKIVGDRFYTSNSGVLNIRGLANGKTYRLVETKAPEGYDNSTLATSKEFAVSFTDKNDVGNNKDLSVTNKKAEYKVTYKVVKNPEGEEIPAGSPTAPVDGSTYTFNSTVDVKPDLVFDGYEFIGWHTENGQTPVVNDTDGSFTMPSKNVELVGYWKKSTKDITIKYISEDVNMGTVTVPSETLNDTTGTAQGSVAKEKDGYEFVGWYKLSDAGKTIISNTSAFVPEKDSSDQKYHEETYVAQFKARETISVSVEKKWVGKEGTQVEIKLLADGEEKETLTLNAANQWKGQFNNLYKFDKADGHEIKYTVKEVSVAGYTSVISGTAQTGFTITNTITGKVSVPVTKKWIGKEADSVTVHLYADGTDTGKSATLNAANQWQYTFVNLEQYKDGKAIKYTIKEDAIAGYESEVSGDMQGYTVTNTNTETMTIPVEKKWIGKEGSQVDVKLLVDGEEKETLTLNAANQWKGEFKNLYKYDQTDGHEIKYTVKEVSVAGYTSAISGTAQTGFTITNTENPVPPKTPTTSDRNNPLRNGIGLGISLVLAGFALVYKKKYSA